MNAQSETFEDEYEEYDEFDEEDGEDDRGLSGLVVLLMGVVMLGAFASIVWIAYQQGIRTGIANGNVPTVVADPEPLKIENQIADAAKDADRPVYDQFDGSGDDQVEVLAEGPEEPVTRVTEDPIAAIAAENQQTEIVDDAVKDRIAELAAQDEALAEAPARQTASPKPSVPEVAAPKPAPVQPRQAAAAPAPVATNAGAHVVQVGAFRSEAEANQQWTRLQTKMGDYLGGKGPDIEYADLGEKGVYYRLRIAPFSSSDDAKAYCEGLKSRGQDCLVKAK